MQLRSHRPLHVQGDAGHLGQQGGGPKRIIGKMECRGGKKAQGVADPPKKFYRKNSLAYYDTDTCSHSRPRFRSSSIPTDPGHHDCRQFATQYRSGLPYFC
jgi:hypothetical protein